MATLQIQIDDREVQQALSQLVRRASNLRPAFQAIGEYLLARTEQRFNDQVSPEGVGWADLAASTIKRKQRTGGIDKKLQDRGFLIRSIAYRATADSVEVGSNMVYAVIHQFGGTIHQYAQSRYQEVKIDRRTGQQRFAKKGKGNFQQRATFGERDITIPPRPFLGINDRDVEEIGAIVLDFLVA